MKEQTYHFPAQVGAVNALQIVKDLSCLPESKTILIDFSQTKWIEPFAMLCISECINRLKDERPRSRFFGTNFSSLTYAAHMGFFKAWGMNFGNRPGEAQGGATHLPITRISIKELSGEAAKNYEPVGEAIERCSEKLAQMLVQDGDESLLGALSYSLRELIRNVAEHSESEALLYCAQYWPGTGRVEVSLVDSGIGILRSISDNPKVDVQSDIEALKVGMLPGVSGKVGIGAKQDDYDVWKNTGYGLYMISRLCGSGGEFLIGSGDACLSITDGKRDEIGTHIVGTSIKMLIDTSNLKSLSDSLAQFVSEGEKISKALHGHAAVGASVASKMLSPKSDDSTH